ncbi:conserved hypothetical protein [Paecilomyces variotii No. 5]|uniref:Uncharacterized protein n=1 Tax=Byssochlamys spectabilis (strain No. 5 / NBRC 109023) TaxID=1356009 RepID=V5FSU2_BYSSN|nr:conserved hypothetical protein [Paecilomyces variotii No. 5]
MVTKELDKFGRAQKSRMSFGYLGSSQSDMAATAKHWNNLLGAFYNRTVDISNMDMANVLRNCVGLLETAESIEASEIIRQSIDIALLRQGQTLWRSIASQPIPWANLGDRIHSPTIFRDAVIHIVGKWNSLADEQRSVLYPNVRNLCEKKYHELQLKMQAIEMRVVGHYPAFLQRKPSENIYRATYANDVYMWMAVCFYRQWYCQQSMDGRTRAAKDGGAAFFRAVGAGGRAYLNTQDQARFHLYFPMSSKARSILEKNLDVLKADIRPLVSDLLIDNSQLDTAEYGQLPHLTCCDVKQSEMTWTTPQASENPSDNEEELTDSDAENETDEDGSEHIFLSPQEKVDPDSEHGENRTRAGTESLADGSSAGFDEEEIDESGYEEEGDDEDDEEKVFL